MDYIEMARRMRPFMVDFAKEFDDETALFVPYMFDAWSADEQYATGDRVRYNETLYKVLQPHTAQIGWEPNVATSLFAEVLPGQDGDIGEWVQPDSTNAYMRDDKVTHNGFIWESKIDYNIWEPGTVGTETLWVVVE